MPSLKKRGRLRLPKILREHELLFLSLLILTVIAAGSQWLLKADIIGQNGPNPAVVVAKTEDPRACTSVGTIFEDLERPIDVIKKFQAETSKVMAERENILRKPSLWQCFDTSGEIRPPAMPLLEALAADLPGWNYGRVTAAGDRESIRKPVSFQAFASVVMELEREYECRLVEFETNSTSTVLANKDRDTVTAEDDPNELTFSELDLRVDALKTRMRRERVRARTALEHTINTLRSFETGVLFTVQMSCFQRAALDVRSELSLLADEISCMPKLWDNVNSLHDTKAVSPPQL